MTLEEAILATTPQGVYDKLVTISGDLPVDPGDGSCCPLWHFFTEEYPDEGRVWDDDETHQSVGVDLDSVRFGDGRSGYYQLPDWMHLYQSAMMEAKITDMDGAIVILTTLFPGVEV